jgi:hypothetical protein
LLAVLAAIAIAAPALAQSLPGRQAPATPPRPFQEKGPGTDPLQYDVVSPERRTKKIEARAAEREAGQGRALERETHFTIQHARSVAEFDALGRYSILILTVITQNAEELPLKRVYLRMPDREVLLLKLGGWRRDVDQASVSYKMYGRYREDGLYLFPTGAFLKVAQLQVDFAASRMGLPVLELPSSSVPDWLSTLQNPDPLPGALPDLKALQEFMKAGTTGFPIPTSLPRAPETRRPAPAAVAQPDEPKQPASLKDLFKK